jgi:hypothetical protein
MLKTEEIRVRDPYIVAHGGKYYLYSSTLINEQMSDRSVYVYVSTDCREWEEPKPIFTVPEDFWGDCELWASEVHLYRGKFYLFVSLPDKSTMHRGLFCRRGTQIAVSDTPDGTFLPIADRSATPLTQSCIDGTLYVEDDVPYIVYSHDWPDNFKSEKNGFVGQICAQQLSPDLTEPVGEPFLLFSSDEAAWSAAAPTRIEIEGKPYVRFGSDAPFLSRMQNGSLLLTWSPLPAGNYVVGAVVSKSGRIHGPWEHLDTMIYDQNGGHAMFFNDFDGTRKMCIHCPERTPEERALILTVEEDGDTYKVI